MTGWLRRARGLPGLIASVVLIGGPACECAGLAVQPSAPQSATDVLRQMSDRAGVIFVGQVAAVRRSSLAPGVVEVDFRVETAIRGCAAGRYTLREWAGLWSGNDQRYRVAERVLLLLHAPSAAGLSSPVDGLDGVIPIREAGTATPPAGQPGSLRVADLRWVGAKALRPVSYRPAVGEGERRLPSPAPLLAGSQTLVSLRSGVAADVSLPAPVPDSTRQDSMFAGQVSIGAVLGLLQTWERTRNATP